MIISVFINKYKAQFLLINIKHNYFNITRAMYRLKWNSKCFKSLVIFTKEECWTQENVDVYDIEDLI